jgi:hypothetical protein
VLLAGATWGCDGTSRGLLDASAAPSSRISTLSLRIDVAQDKPPTLTALGFRAAFSGISATDVVTLVDPLATSPGHDCQINDIGSAAAALSNGENGVELEELGSVGINVDSNPDSIRLSPRLFPDVAPAMGGVVSEAGPLAMNSGLPAQLRVTTDASAETAGSALLISVPSAGQIAAVNGLVPSARGTTTIDGDMKLDLVAGGPGESAVEVRPLGATPTLICRVPTDAGHAGAISFVVSHQLMANLIAATGATQGRPVAASLDLVRRISSGSGASDARVAVEVRTSTLLELHP